MTGQPATIGNHTDTAHTATQPAAGHPAAARLAAARRTARPGFDPRPRLLSGDRPTGRLHLGHYLGSIANRVRLARQYESFIIIADLHMLTTHSTRADIAAVGPVAREMVLDQLAAGLDPQHCVFYLQSAIPEIAEVSLLIQSLVTVPRLQRVPSLKEMARAAGQAEMPFALLGYPVLQAADILSVRARAVPVGPDNAAHVEVAREIARRFNRRYGRVFPVPALVPAPGPSLPGTDGRGKMSKSAGNAIYLSDSPDEVRRKVAGMYTDPARVRAGIPGTVAGNPVFAYHDAFNDRPAEVAELKARYQAGTVGDVEVKQRLAEAVIRFLDPIRERRARFAADAGLADRLIAGGTARVRREVQRTVTDMRAAMGLPSRHPLAPHRAR
jgi:tryptophanyl-tRNA synthetase